MSDQIQDDKHLELKERLRKVRFQLTDLKVSIHFLDLKEFIRMALTEAFPVILVPDLAVLLEKPEGLIRRWHDQVALIEEIKVMILRHKEMYNKKNLFENPEIVDSVLRLVQGTSPNLVSRALDEAISQTSIRRWILSRVEGVHETRVIVRSKKSEDVGTIEDYTTPSHASLGLETVTQKDLECEKVYASIEESPDAIKLAGLLVRHEENIYLKPGIRKTQTGNRKDHCPVSGLSTRIPGLAPGL